MKHILILEDDDIYRETLKIKLSGFGRVFEASSLYEALKIYEAGHLDIAFVDLDLGERLEGLKFLEKTKGLKSVILSSHEEEKIIEKAYMLGATTYLNKWNNFEELYQVIQEILGISSIDVSNFYQTKCKKLKRHILESLELFYKSDLPMLITGETGVGKSQFTRKIAKKDPFVQVNLSEFGSGTIESELFGHKKGSFTGAIDNKVGLLEKANGGILFIDEIGVLSLEIQKKLLKVIEEKEFYPVGSSKPVRSNFRLVTATCDDLKTLLESGRIREDFFYRINAIELCISPLRERADDIISFINFTNKSSVKRIFFEENAIDVVKNSEWRGNYRELKAFIYRLRKSSSGLIKESLVREILTKEDISIELDYEMRALLKEKGLRPLLNKIEELSLDWASSQGNGKVNEIVRTLGISKSLFYRISESASVSS